MYPADLKGSAFIGFDEDLRIRRELDRFLRAQGVEVNLVMHFDNMQAVALGQGISILRATERLLAMLMASPEG